MTVKQLKKLLNDAPDKMRVMLCISQNPVKCIDITGMDDVTIAKVNNAKDWEVLNDPIAGLVDRRHVECAVSLY